MDPNLYVGFSEGQGWLPKLIRVFAGGAVNHAFLAWQDLHLGWVVLGANVNGVTLDTWSNFVKTRRVPAIFRAANPAQSLWLGLGALRNDINARYDTRALVGMGLVEIARRVFDSKIANPFDDNRTEVFCSEFATMVIRGSGFKFLPDYAPDTIDPQQMMHELARRSDFVQGPLPS